ncbi:MAG: hypothetical protein HC932_04150 [Thermales bacterium]|nr:hypothetical protein [Thermales bacterium]
MKTDPVFLDSDFVHTTRTIEEPQSERIDIGGIPPTALLKIMQGLRGFELIKKLRPGYSPELLKLGIQMVVTVQHYQDVTLFTRIEESMVLICL